MAKEDHNRLIRVENPEESQEDGQRKELIEEAAITCVSAAYSQEEERRRIEGELDRIFLNFTPDVSGIKYRIGKLIRKQIREESRELEPTCQGIVDDLMYAAIAGGFDPADFVRNARYIEETRDATRLKYIVELLEKVPVGITRNICVERHALT